MKGRCQCCDEEYFVNDPKDRFCSRLCAYKWELARFDEAAWEDEGRLEEPRPFPSRDDYIDGYGEEPQ